MDIRLMNRVALVVGVVVACAFETGAATEYGEIELRRRAVLGGDGKIAVLSDGHAVWAVGSEADKMFDGLTSTFYDPMQVADDTWVGYEFSSPQVLTRLRFIGRVSGTSDDRYVTSRMRASVIQGANQPDFSDAVQLHALKDSVPEDWHEHPYWIEAGVNAANRGVAFRYFRVLQPKSGTSSTFAGNLAELEVFGRDAGAAKAFDGDAATVLNLTAGDSVAKDFGRVVDLSELRLVPGANPAALVGARIEVSDTADFASPRTVLTLAEAPASTGVTVLPLASASGRAVRLVAASDCELAEIAFVPAASAAVVTMGDDGGRYTRQAVVSWSPVGQEGRVRIERATGSGGPWTTVATPVPSALSWTDTTAPAGVRQYYRVVTTDDACGETIDLAASSAVSHRRAEPLERTAANRTALRDGVSIVYKYGGRVWTPETSDTAAGVTNSVMLAFDDKVPTGTDGAHNGYNYADIQAVAPRTCLGVDFGTSPCYVETVRLNWGVWSSNSGRINGTCVAGSVKSNWNEDGQFENVAGPLSHSGETFHWYELPCTQKGPYRYMFVHNPSNNGWGCNVSELEFYGWPVANVSGVAAGVSDLSVRRTADGVPVLTWTRDSDYGASTVERRTFGTDAWTAVATGLSGTSWTDEGVAVDGASYEYRVKTVNGEAYAYSDTVGVTLYRQGAGTGLHGVWTTPYDSTKVTGDEVVTVTTNAAVALQGDDSSPNTLVKWTGRLIVPHAADWTFEAEADDTLSLWIDGKAVLYSCSTGAARVRRLSQSVQLAAGEHELTAVYWRQDGTGDCRLYWSGGVLREVIPSTQLIPVAPSAMPSEWAGARTFTSSPGTNCVGDVAFRTDGAIDIAFGGDDIYYAHNDYLHLWREVTGDFTMTIRLQGLPATARSGQKAGLMVRNLPTAAAAFEAFMIQSAASGDVTVYRLGGKYRAIGEKDIKDSLSIGSTSTWEEFVGETTWLKLRRKGGKFYGSAKIGDGGTWKLYFERSAAGYGETVYVGPAAAGGDTDQAFVPSYYWRVSNAAVRESAGLSILIR